MSSFLLFDLFFWSYAGLLLTAAVLDVTRFVIPNWISLGLVALFCIALVVHPAPIDWRSHLIAFGLVTTGLVVAYRFGVFGGGDLKLMAVVTLWCGLDAVPQLLLSTAIAGGAFALGLTALRRILTGLLLIQPLGRQVALPRLLLPGEAVPYGVAIAVGGLLVARKLPHLGLFV